ncbi:ParB/Srx family N-terminal domain-containing protein [Hyphomicrobium sulfonivorans]|uniref:ParB/Srx family N-terminal domain-containing protein n=1 Tax=Hyphomicrobium sulfonivorans TaxID=121290 RepID=UPI001570669C|nr:ParB/Srx family N-terminal domain-containing protein [Hyphomicrobium sulfonivorans]MBI1649862.1 ParB N-terminal domain-containing protein [Hyphomicrobium sulfonivorans]NSL71772.1 chromosome partitioning protein ParB [Hyphomicrobium sulfonivorans]
MAAPTKPALWPADAVERWPVDDLIPYARNSRTHSDEQVMQIARSIEQFGWTIPVLVAEDGTIIAGHGRVLAARVAGIDEVPVMIARGWTDAQRRAYTIADNKLAENAGWDLDALKLELADLGEINFDLDVIGFSDAEIDDLLSAGQDDEADSAEDDAPKAKLAERFGIPPFSILNAREGWWQDRKRAWLALGIESELGRGDAPIGGAPMPMDRKKANAEPGGSKLPAANYSKNKARGDGRGRAVVDG